MTSASPHILQVLTGTVAPLGAAGKTSAIAKQPVAGPVAIGPLGLQGDAQAAGSVLNLYAATMIPRQIGRAHV